MKVLFKDDEEVSLLKRLPNLLVEVKDSIIYKFKRAKWIIRRHINLHTIVKRSYDFETSSGIEMLLLHIEESGQRMAYGKTYTVGAEKRGRDMLFWVRWMRKVMDEDYSVEYQDQIQALYGKREMKFNDAGNGLKSMSFEYTNKNYSEKELENIERVSTALFLKSQRRQKSEMVLAWKYFCYNHQSWWD